MFRAIESLISCCVRSVRDGCLSKASRGFHPASATELRVPKATQMKFVSRAGKEWSQGWPESRRGKDRDGNRDGDRQTDRQTRERERERERERDDDDDDARAVSVLKGLAGTSGWNASPN